MGLEKVLHPAQEWMINVKHYLLFQQGISDLLIVDKLIFSYGLDRILLLCLSVLSQVYATESSLAKLSQQVKV